MRESCCDAGGSSSGQGGCRSSEPSAHRAQLELRGHNRDNQRGLGRWGSACPILPIAAGPGHQHLAFSASLLFIASQTSGSRDGERKSRENILLLPPFMPGEEEARSQEGTASRPHEHPVVPVAAARNLNCRWLRVIYGDGATSWTSRGTAAIVRKSPDGTEFPVCFFFFPPFLCLRSEKRGARCRYRRPATCATRRAARAAVSPGSPGMTQLHGRSMRLTQIQPGGAGTAASRPRSPPAASGCARGRGVSSSRHPGASHPPDPVLERNPSSS